MDGGENQSDASRLIIPSLSRHVFQHRKIIRAMFDVAVAVQVNNGARALF
jgi:hypothetical protein